MLDEKDCTDEKIESVSEEQSTQTIMRRRNDYWNDTRQVGFLWDDKSQDIVREKVACGREGKTYEN